jgi:hypothetical protein
MKINKSFILITLLLLSTAVISSFITKKIVWDLAYKKFNPKLTKHYADIVHSFSEGEEKHLLHVANSIMGVTIAYMDYNTSDDKKFACTFCSYLNPNFKKSILDNYNAYIEDMKHENNLSNITSSQHDRESFLKGYSKLTHYCNNQKIKQTPISSK